MKRSKLKLAKTKAVRLSDAAHERLTKAAAREGRTVSEEASRLVLNTYDATGARPNTTA